MSWEVGVVLLLCAFSIGALAGKALADSRWRSNSKVPYRLPSGGRLFKVEDVTPWRQSDE